MIVLSWNLFANVPGVHNAPLGGVFNFHLSSTPLTLNPLSSSDYYASKIHEYTLESLAFRNIDTWEWMPLLAESWVVAKDGMSFTFKLRKGVKWHDGKPLTIEDVKFSFDAIVHPKNKYKTAHLKPYYENIKKAEILDKQHIRFFVKRKYYKNFNVLAGLDVIPRHVYENPTKKQSKKLNKTLVGSGPYILDKYKRGRSVSLVSNPSWWGRNDPYNKGRFNFRKVVIKFIKDKTIRLQMLERKDIDYLDLAPDQYVKKTGGKQWGKDVFKVKTVNKAPKGYSFIGWNQRDSLFKNRNVRKALYHLVNRKLMIKKFLYGFSTLATGPHYSSSIYANPKVKPIEFDPKKALALLRKEGWRDTNGDRILDKVIDGKRVDFKFTILEPSKDFEKFLTVFKEDAAKAGVQINIKIVEWSTFLKLLEERKFQAVRLGWGSGGVDWDPKQIWHSDYVKSGSNFIGYENKQVDKMIDQARVTLNKKKRIKILHNVFKMIAEDYPYVFFFNSKYILYGHSKNVEKEKDSYVYNVGVPYWWMRK